MIQNLEAEETLLGLALTDMPCAERVSALPDDTFSYEQTIEIFKVVRQLVKERQVPDLVTVHARLSKTKTALLVDTVGQCINLAISTAMYPQIERVALDARKRRRMQNACVKIANMAADPAEDVDNLANELNAVINDSGEKPQSISMMEASVDYLDNLGKPESTISTGIAGLDRITGGFQNSMLVVLGARPKVGKTALAMTMAIHIAQKTGPVLVNSLEMSTGEILHRIMANETRINMKKLVTKDLDQSDWENIADKFGHVSQYPIRFAKLQTPLLLRREASSMQRNGGLSMIVVDYIQLMKPDEKTNSRYEAVSSITRELKLMAMDLDVPILALTQFNRESEQGGVRRKPSMAEARDSGSIEQDANMFLIQYPPTEPKTSSELYDFWEACQRDGKEFQVLEIAANRQGPTGFVPMKFDKSHMKFMTMVREGQ